MRSRTRLLLALPLILLASCRAIFILLLIPVVVVAVVFGGLAGIFVSSEGPTDEAELYAGGIHIVERTLEVDVAADQTFEGTLVVVSSVTSAAGLEHAQQASLSFDPRSQELEFVAASVVNPDGTVHVVEEDAVFERPSPVASEAPGFVSSKTKSVLFPQLVVGSQTHIEWRFREKAPSALGFTYSWRPSFAYPVDESRIRITYHPDVPLQFDAEEPFELVEGEDGDLKFAEATLRNYAAQTPERAMVAARDVCPEFLVTTTQSWEAIGAAFHTAVASRVEVTPEIQALAEEIVGEREGVDAARAIHRWVCANVHYVVLYLHPMDGWVPHAASEVLENRYGDCKDKYVLTASLLSAQGIDAEPVLVNFDRSFDPHALPTPLQFNHCMAYLPEFDLYSNTTDPYRDLGDLDTSLSGKFVVIGTPNGKTSRTPEGDPDENGYHVSHEVRIGQDGIVSGRSVMDFDGRSSGGFRRQLALAGAPEQAADSLLHAGALGGHGDLQTTDPTDLDVPLHCEGEWTSDIPIAMGPEIHFIAPVGIDIVNPQLIRDFLSSSERRYPTLIAAVELTWRYELQLPDGYVFDALPEGRMQVTPAGRFESSYSLTDDGRLLVERLLRIEHDRFRADEYGGLRTILRESVIDMNTILSARFET
jgi:transglutaminase-like putative cysteine protease